MDITWWIVGSLALILIIVVALIIWVEMSFKFHVIERQLVKGRRVIRHDKAKVWKDKDKNKWWRLKKVKDKELRKLPIPPSDAIEITHKGKKFIEYYRTETGEVIYIKDDSIIAPIPHNLYNKIPQSITTIQDDGEREKKINDWKKKILSNWYSKEKVTTVFKPLTTEHRQIMINEYRKAHARRKHKWTESLPTIVSIGALVLIIIALMVFWGDIAKPVIDAIKERTVQLQIQQETLILVQEIKEDIQRIDDEKPTEEEQEIPI